MAARRAIAQVASSPASSLMGATFGLGRMFMTTPIHTDNSFSHSKEGKVLHPDLLNDAVKRTQYAVRGELYLRAMQLQEEGMKITFTNGA
jgi:hypothetical protein